MTYLPLFLLFSLACCTPGGSGYSSGADSEAAALVHTAEGISSGLQTGHLLSRKVRKASSKKVAKSGKKSKKTGKNGEKSVQRSKNGKKPGQKAKKSKNKDQKSGRKVKKTVKKNEKFGKKVIKTKKSKKTGKKDKKSEKKSKKTKKSGKKFRNKAKKSGKKTKKSGKKFRNKAQKSGKKSKKTKKPGKKSKKTKKPGKKLKNKATKSGKKSKNSGKKEKKFMKSKNKSRKKGKKERKGKKTNEQSITISNACFSEFVALASVYGNQAKNIEKQAARAKIWERKIIAKSGKKADFDESYSMILAAAGGDPNDPKCQGVTPEATDPLAGIILTLKDCNANIEAQCSASPLSQADSDLLDKCETNAREFRTYYDTKLKNVGATATAPNDVCTLVSDQTIKDLKSELIACRTPVLDITNAQKTKNTDCNTAFAKCKSQAIASTDRLDKCKVCTSGPANQVIQLCSVNTALTITIAIFGNALNGLGLAGGTGSNGVCGSCALGAGRKIRAAKKIASEYDKLPSHKLNRDVLSRKRRQDGEGCLDVRAAWEKFNATATASGMSSGQQLNESDVDSTISALNAIVERKNLTGDLMSCDTEIAEKSDINGDRLARHVSTVTLSIVYIRVYYFWCISWQQVVIVARIQILITTASLPVPACITTVG